MLVSIVTPSFQQARFLRAAVESVLGQDYPEIEYLVMDGGSTDGSVEILRGYGSRIQWVSEPDRGQSHAVNKGWQRSRGGILGWVNSDDVLTPGAVRQAVEAFAAHPEAGVVYGEGGRIDAAGTRIGRYPHTRPFDLAALQRTDYILQPATFWRRAAVEEAGWLDEDIHYPMDWDLLLRIARRHPLVHISRELACERLYATTKTSTGGVLRMREIHRILRRSTGAWMPAGAVVYGCEIAAALTSGWLRRNVPFSRPLQMAVNGILGIPPKLLLRQR